MIAPCGDPRCPCETGSPCIFDAPSRIRDAFRIVALGLMQWKPPAELSPREYRRLEAIPEPRACARREK